MDILHQMLAVFKTIGEVKTLSTSLFLSQRALCYRSVAMTDPAFNNPTPQFGTAEYADPAGNDHCQFCHQPIGGTYYRVNDAMACPACADKARYEVSRDTHAAFMRALLFGVGAAIAGMILYAVFAIATGLIIGYVSLAVGWMVGKAMMKGSGGVGGRRYQITAALLTYLAVSMAAVPIAIHYSIEHEHERKQQSTTGQASGQSSSGQSSSGQSSDDEFERQEQKANPNYTPPPPTNRTEALMKLALYGVASPFFELFEGGPTLSWGIGIFILIIGLRIAWRMTAGVPLQIDGPFQGRPFEDSQPAR